MKIRILSGKCVAGPQGTATAGMIVDWPEDFARQLIDGGVAVSLEEVAPPAPAEPSPIETASAKPAVEAPSAAPTKKRGPRVKA